MKKRIPTLACDHLLRGGDSIVRLIRRLVWLRIRFLRWRMELMAKKFRRAQQRYWRAVLAPLKRRRKVHMVGAPEVAVELRGQKVINPHDSGIAKRGKIS